MKKPLALSLALLYTATVLGFALNFHYCFNQVSNIAINQPVKMCTSQKLVKAPSCCKDKHVDIKIKDNHQVSASQFVVKNIAFQLSYSNYTGCFIIKANGLSVASYERGPPPDLSNQPAIFLFNNNFRI